MDEKKKQGTLNGDTKNENGGHKNDELKNLIASYVAEAIKNEKATWEKDFSDRIVSEREEAAKMATMSAEDRAKAEMDISERLKGVPPKISREKENLTDPFLSGLGM